jgi:hypothetical protein
MPNCKVLAHMHMRSAIQAFHSLLPNFHLQRLTPFVFALASSLFPLNKIMSRAMKKQKRAAHAVSSIDTEKDLVNFEKKSTKQKIIFGRQVVLAGVSLFDLEGVQKKGDIHSRSSALFYQPSLVERAGMVSQIPLPPFLKPILHNEKYFRGVFGGRGFQKRLIAHHEAHEDSRLEIMGMFKLKTKFFSPCSFFNGLLSFCGERIVTSMVERKKYSGTQFVVLIPLDFCFNVFMPGLEVCGWERVETSIQGRCCLETKSKFVLEATIASMHASLDGKRVNAKLVLLPVDQRIGAGYEAGDVNTDIMLDKCPYEMSRHELLEYISRNNFFGKEAVFFENCASYELAQAVIDFFITQDNFVGVEYVYSLTKGTDGLYGQIMAEPERRGFGLARIVVCVFMSKYKVQYDAELGTHQPTIEKLL